MEPQPLRKIGTGTKNNFLERAIRPRIANSEKIVFVLFSRRLGGLVYPPPPICAKI
jgi:hypothetical protein